MYSLDLVSELGFWFRDFEQAWRYVDFLRSEDASAMLLDAMPNAKLHHDSRRGIYWWHCIPAAPGEYSPAIHIDRKSAVFLAALNWKGIERPEGL